jgi:hypothetical protein
MIDELLSLLSVDNSYEFVTTAYINRLRSFSDQFLVRQALLLKHWLTKADMKIARCDLGRADVTTLSRAIAHMRVLYKVLLSVLEERRSAREWVHSKPRLRR